MTSPFDPDTSWGSLEERNSRKTEYFFFKSLSHSRISSYIVGAFTKIEKSHTQTSRPGKSTYHAGIEPITAQHLVTQPLRQTCRQINFRRPVETEVSFTKQHSILFYFCLTLRTHHWAKATFLSFSYLAPIKQALVVCVHAI